MNQKGLLPIPVVVIFAALVGVVVFLFITRPPSRENNQANKAISNNKTCTFGVQNLQKIQVPLQSAEDAFANPLTDIETIDKITPGSQTSDARLTYLWIKDNQQVPIFAPADGTLVKIAYKKRVDFGPEMSQPDYDLTFMVDCKTIYQINHITDPDPEIAALKSNTEPYQTKPGSPLGEEDTIPLQNFTVKAGQKLGTTTGTPNAHSVDFGIFINQQAVCPYEQYAEPLRSNWLSLFKEGACRVSGTY